jgi:hypothetical protein
VAPRRNLLIALVALLAASASASAAGAPRVIHADRAVGPIRIARTTASQAIAALPGPHHTVRHRPGCRIAWPALGLAVDFTLIGTDPRDPCVAGIAVVATATSRAAWRTALGLRVGDTVARLRKLYPKARRKPYPGEAGGYWLVSRHACEVVGAFPYPGLLGRSKNGRVTALVARTAICD